MNTYNQKVILILGGTGSIGSCIADALEQQGVLVVRHGRNGSYAYDVSNEQDTNAAHVFVEKIIQEFGRIDAVVNSLSSSRQIARFEKKTWHDFLGHLHVQLKAAVEIERNVIHYMKKQGKGKIVHVLTSAVMGTPPASMSDYVTAKYAMLGLTKAMAKELGRDHITVNAVSPGFIKNKFNSKLPEKLSEIIEAETPIGSLTTEDNVMRAVLFLLSDDADHITGENINISGGHVMQ